MRGEILTELDHSHAPLAFAYEKPWKTRAVLPRRAHMDVLPVTIVLVTRGTEHGWARGSGAEEGRNVDD